LRTSDSKPFEASSVPTQTQQTQQTDDTTSHSSNHYDEQLASLTSLIAEQQAQLAALTEEVAYLRAVQLSTPAELITSSQTTPDAMEAEPAQQHHDAGRPHVTSRRNLLKWGGVGAAAALAAAGSGALGHEVAHAADGANLVLGTSNTAEHSTILSSDSSSGFIIFSINGSNTSGNTALLASASGATSYAVVGLNDFGNAVVGNASSGIDVAAVGAGRIYQHTAPFTGAPTSGTYFKGEQIRDDNGNLYICIVGDGSDAGVWLKVAAGAPGISGAITFLANPIRLLDTRKSSPYNAGSNHTLQVTGVSVGGISIPAGAIGVVGNVTVVDPTSGGDLRLYPGPALPATSSINFASGQIIANGVTVGLNGSGQLLIQVDMSSGAHTNVLFDASGYIL